MRTVLGVVGYMTNSRLRLLLLLFLCQPGTFNCTWLIITVSPQQGSGIMWKAYNIPVFLLSNTSTLILQQVVSSEDVIDTSLPPPHTPTHMLYAITFLTLFGTLFTKDVHSSHYEIVNCPFLLNLTVLSSHFDLIYLLPFLSN